MRGISVVWAGVFAAALVASVLVARGLEARGGTDSRPPDDPVYLPSATFLRYASLGYRHMLADFMWIRATQYFGKHLEARKRFQGRYKFLFPMLDLTTSLDPQFVHAYRFGGLLLVVVRQYENAIALYEKGYAANPHRWEMPHDLGRLYYLELKDSAKALHWWQITEKLPGHPDYIPRFIPLLYLETGQREIAIALWLEMYNATDNAWLRDVIRGRLESLGVKVGE
jgi:tetratricopeptide (TPR) repeat protein